MNFIPCMAWIKRGVSKEVPEKVQLSKEELKKLIEESVTDLKDLKVGSDDETGEAENRMDDEEDVVAKYNLESYDEEKPPAHFTMKQFVDLSTEEKEVDEVENDQQDRDSDDEADFKIRPSDNLIAVGHVADDYSTLEVYVYNEEDTDLYVHHDIILPAFPLCMEWLDFDPIEEKQRNYLAIGDMTSVINIWDMDMVDILEPIFKLGKKLKKKDKRRGTSGDHGHGDAVLDLAWNKRMSHILASGSADNSVILWDLATCSPATHLTHHTQRVQSIEWHPYEAEILLTGSSDKKVTVYDCKAIEEKKSWQLDEEIEKVLWNHFDPFCFLVGTDQGSIFCFDVRLDEPVFKIDAHTKAIGDMSLSSSCPGLVVSCDNSPILKVWDIRNNQGTLVDKKKLLQGNLFCCRGSPDSPFIIAVGGDKAESNFKVLDLLQFKNARCCFAPKEEEEYSVLPQQPKIKREKIEGVFSLSSPSQQKLKQEMDNDDDDASLHPHAEIKRERKSDINTSSQMEIKQEMADDDDLSSQHHDIKSEGGSDVFSASQQIKQEWESFSEESELSTAGSSKSKKVLKKKTLSKKKWK